MTSNKKLKKIAFNYDHTILLGQRLYNFWVEIVFHICVKSVTCQIYVFSQGNNFYMTSWFKNRNGKLKERKKE